MIFLFTKIDHPAVYQARGTPEADHIISCQLFLLEETLSSYKPRWTKRTPDGVLCIFQEGDPAQAAISAQKDFQRHLWGSRFEKAKLRVVLHSGDAVAIGQNYVGPDVTHALKLLDAAWGGQTLLTVPAVHFVPLPPGARLIDLGLHFLKDLSEPSNVYGLVHPELEDPPSTPLKSLNRYPQNFFPQVSPFCGRGEEIGEVTRLLKDPSVRLLTLAGPGGFGKTRLAFRSAAELVDTFPDGVYLVILAPLLSDQMIVGNIANVLQFFFYGTDDPKAQILNHLKDKKMLLVMDNFEHIIGGAQLVTDILKAAPGVKILATSRERLKAEGEKVFEVGGLRYPETPEDTDLEAYSAVQLFLLSARRTKPDYVLAPGDRPEMLAVCRLLEGMPLGLELASNWVGMLSLAQIAEKIESSRDFLATSMPHFSPRQRSLRAVFEYSWILLSEPQKKVLKALSAFKGGFRLEAARRVAGATEAVLAQLESKSLLNRVTADRFDGHELVKFYAKEKLFDDPKEEEKVLDAHCHYYASFLQRREKGLFGAEAKRVMNELTDELGNLREAWARAIRNRMEKEIGRLLKGFHVIHEIKGRFDQGQELMETAVQSLREKYPGTSRRPRSSTLLLARLLCRQAFFEKDLGNFDKACRLLEESLGLLSAASALKEAGLSLAGLGIVNAREGHYLVAQSYYEKSLAAFRKVKDTYGIALVLNHFGQIACKMGLYQKAEAFIRQSLRHSSAVRDQRAMAYAYNVLGDVNINLSRLKEGRECYQKALLFYVETGDRRGTAWSLVNLGQVAENTGDFLGAREMYQQAMGIAGDIFDRVTMAWTRNQLGVVCWQLGEYQQAANFHQEALSLYRQLMDFRGEAWSLELLGNLALACREDRQAEGYYKQALALLQKEGILERNVAWHDYHMGDVAYFRGQWNLAKKWFLKSRLHFETIQDNIGLAVITTKLGEVFARLGDFHQAEQHLTHAVKIAYEGSLTAWLVDAMVSLGRLSQMKGEEKKAIGFFMLALRHPMCRWQTKDSVITQARELKSHFSAEEAEGAQEWAKTVTLEEVAEKWVSSRMPAVRRRKNRKRKNRKKSRRPRKARRVKRKKRK